MQFILIKHLISSKTWEWSKSRVEVKATCFSFLDWSSRHVIRWNCTQLCPFSFDLRDSMRRVAHEQKLTRLRELDVLYPVGLFIFYHRICALFIHMALVFCVRFYFYIFLIFPCLVAVLKAQPFTANPVRKYKPLVLQKSSRKLTIPRSPFSSRDDA